MNDLGGKADKSDKGWSIEGIVSRRKKQILMATFTVSCVPMCYIV